MGLASVLRIVASCPSSSSCSSSTNIAAGIKAKLPVLLLLHLDLVEQLLLLLAWVLLQGKFLKHEIIIDKLSFVGVYFVLVKRVEIIQKDSILFFLISYLGDGWLVGGWFQSVDVIVYLQGEHFCLVQGFDLSRSWFGDFLLLGLNSRRLLYFFADDRRPILIRSLSGHLVTVLLVHWRPGVGLCLLKYNTYPIFLELVLVTQSHQCFQTQIQHHFFLAGFLLAGSL